MSDPFDMRGRWPTGEVMREVNRQCRTCKREKLVTQTLADARKVWHCVMCRAMTDEDRRRVWPGSV